MLEGLAKALPLHDEVAIRAAMHLARDHGRTEMKKALVEVAEGKRDEVRGLAAAALWDLGDRDFACEIAKQAESSRSLGSLTWSALVAAAAAGKVGSDVLLAEPTFRRVQWGWVE
jgi:hypothetical protein